MALSFKLFYAFLVLLFIYQQGKAESCSVSNIVVAQSKTGKVVEGKPEYNVIVENNCGCPQFNVVVQCHGLSSVEPVDPTAIKTIGDTNCLVNGGNALVQGSPVNFNYAWMTPQDFPIVSSKLQCLTLE